MAITFLGLVIGDDGTGFKIPTYSQWRGALSKQIRALRGIANLNTDPGSLFGDFIDLVTTAVDLAGQAASEAVSRTVFNAMSGIALDQFLSDILIRVQASASTAVIWVYGASGSNAPISTQVRASPTGVAFLTEAAVNIPADPTTAYAIEIRNFPPNSMDGQVFTVHLDGNDIGYFVQVGDTPTIIRDNFVGEINGLGLTQKAYPAGTNPTNSRPTLMVIETQGGGSFPLTVESSIPGNIFYFPAASVNSNTGAVVGPTTANAQALRYGQPFAGIQGYTNIDPAVPGRQRETDSQFKARHQITQRGLGGGSPDAIRGVMLSSVEIGGGGLTYCGVEYNPTDITDDVGNLPHSVRIIANQDVVPLDLGNALWRAKAAGDNTNGPFDIVIVDAVGNNQLLHYDLLVDRWISVDMQVEIGPDWPNTGDPLSQLRQDVVDYINNLPVSGANGGVRVNQLPISLFPNGTPRGVSNFIVQLGASFVQADPFPYGDPLKNPYPTPEPDAEKASIAMTSRQKARADIDHVQATIVVLP